MQELPTNCEDCGKLLDWSPESYKGLLEDDVVSAGFVTDDGMPVCRSCAKDYERRAEEEYWQDPASADGLP